MESCRICEHTSDPWSPGQTRHKVSQLGRCSSDNGYSSCGDGCEICSMPSSNDGSDIACSDGVCTGMDGKCLRHILSSLLMVYTCACIHLLFNLQDFSGP